MNEKRNKKITVRFSEAELIEFNDRVPVGLRAAPWLRSLALNEPIKLIRKPPPKVDPELLRTLAGMRGSLNQIAKKVNSSNKVQVIQLLAEIGAIQRDIEILRSNHSHEDDAS